MNFGDRKMQISSEAVPAIRTSPISASASATVSEADPARGLHEHDVARPDEPGDASAAASAASAAACASPSNAVEHRRRTAARRPPARRPRRRRVGADLGGARGSRGAELEHVPEHRRRRPPAGACVARSSRAARMESGLAL